MQESVGIKFSLIILGTKFLNNMEKNVVSILLLIILLFGHLRILYEHAIKEDGK